MRTHPMIPTWVAIAGALTFAGTAAADATIGQHVAVPAYFHPLDPAEPWDRLANSTARVKLAVANVTNGPGYPENEDFAAVIEAAHAEGIKVLGYVDTGYLGTTGLKTRLGQTSAEAWRVQIQQDVNRWYEYYGDDGLDGIFFDQMQNSCGASNAYADFYKSLTEFVKHNHPGAVTVANPGIAVPQCYQDAADILVTFEGRYDCYDADDEENESDGSVCPSGLRFQDPGWDPVDPNKFWHLVYDTSSSQISTAAALSKQRKAGWVYITDDSGDNPWDTLPGSSYWSAVQSAAAPGGSTPDTTAPSVPESLDTVEEWYTWSILDWVKSTDSGGSGVVAYDLYQDGLQIWSVPATNATFQTHIVNGLQPGTWYTFNVRARDGAGNVSALSDSLTFETEPADGIPPTAPGSLQSSNVSYTSVDLSWTPSSDIDDTVVAYDVYRNGSLILVLPPTTTSTTVVGLPWNTMQSLTVKARDSEGNSSSGSTANVTTLSEPAGGWIVDAGGEYTSTTVTYDADFVLPFAFKRVFIDSDNNTSTGYSAFGIGADYVIENGRLFRHVGSQVEYAMVFEDAVEPTQSGQTYTWVVSVSSFASPATTQKVVFQADGAAPYTYTAPVTLVQD